jgi:hypothetical protein
VAKLSLREQQKRWIESYHSELVKKVEDLHQSTKKIEEKQRLLKEKKMLLEKTQKEYENVIVSMEEEKQKKQMELERQQQQQEEAKQRHALYTFKIPLNENCLEVVMSPRQTLPHVLSLCFPLSLML